MVSRKVMMVDAASTSMLTRAETKGPSSRNVDARLRRALFEGGGLKLGFGDENPEIDLWLG